MTNCFLSLNVIVRLHFSLMLELDDEETGYGHGACISRGTYVGAQNVTFIVRQDDSTGYGR